MVENPNEISEGKEKEMHYTPNSYLFTPSVELQEYLNLIDRQKAEIDQISPKSGDLWNIIQQKLRMEWTHHSNAIEGSTLTKSETFFFLREGLTSKGKPFKDYVDAKNHAKAINYLADIIKESRPISETFIKDINALLLQGVTHTKAIDQFSRPTNKPATPGKYKTLPNHVLQLDGTIHKYVEPEQVFPQMEYLVQWVNDKSNNEHPLIIGAMAHYNMVRIHPFDDGNGRGARILMNIILMRNGYPPSVIKNEDRKEYIEAIQSADKGDMNPIIIFIGRSLVQTQEMILEELKQNS